MEARILLQSHNASNLAFLPFEILLGKAQTGKEKWKQGKMLAFRFSESACGRRKEVAEKKPKVLRQSWISVSRAAAERKKLKGGSEQNRKRIRKKAKFVNPEF